MLIGTEIDILERAMILDDVKEIAPQDCDQYCRWQMRCTDYRRPLCTEMVASPGCGWQTLMSIGACVKIIAFAEFFSLSKTEGNGEGEKDE